MVLAGIAAALASLALLPFLEVRPNRVLEGVPIGAIAALGPWLLVPLGILGFLAADAFVRRRTRTLDTLAAASAAAGIASLFLLSGRAAARLVAADPSPTVRISLGPGVWIAAVGLAVAAFSTRRRMAARPVIGALLSLVPVAMVLGAGLAGFLDDLSLVRELVARRDGFVLDLGRHLFLAVSAVALGVVAGVPLALVMHRVKRLEPAAFLVINLAQVVPTLSLLGLLVAPLAALGRTVPLLGRIGVRGVGWAPALVVLFLYSLLPIAGNTLAGLRTISPDVLDAARGMGMDRRLVFLRIQVPLAFPVMLSGVRTALVQNMGNAILAALVGGGGLGTLIFLGLAQASPDLILLGALSVAALALVSDRLLQVAVRLAAPRGVRLTA
jgi:osmoprotectant transport system permease protein